MSKQTKYPWYYPQNAATPTWCYVASLFLITMGFILMFQHYLTRGTITGIGGLIPLNILISGNFMLSATDFKRPLLWRPIILTAGISMIIWQMIYVTFIHPAFTLEKSFLPTTPGGSLYDEWRYLLIDTHAIFFIWGWMFYCAMASWGFHIRQRRYQKAQQTSNASLQNS